MSPMFTQAGRTTDYILSIYIHAALKRQMLAGDGEILASVKGLWLESGSGLICFAGINTIVKLL